MLVFLLVLITSTMLLVRIPTVQTWMAQKAANYLSNKLKTSVEVGSVSISFFDHVLLHDVKILDQKENTLASIRTLDAEIAFFDYAPPELMVREIILDEPYFYLARYPGENQLNIQFLKEAFKASDTSATGLKLELTKLKIRNGFFSYHNHNKAKPDTAYGIDWSHLRLTNIDLNLDGIEIYSDSLKGVMKHLSFDEKSGFGVEHLQGLAYFSETGLSMKQMNLRTNSSHLIGNLSFLYDSLGDLNQFTSKVRIRSDFRPTIVSFNDISYFAPELEGLNRKVTFQGDVFGTIRQLRGRDITARLGRYTSFSGNVDINGLPYINDTYMRLEVDKLITHKADLDSIPMPPFSSNKTVQTPANFAKLGLIRFTGEFSGFFNDFVAYGNFYTDLGKIRTDLSLRLDSVSSRSAYSGFIALTDFQAGKFFSLPWLGTTTAKADIKGRGFTTQDISASIKGDFAHIDVKGYRYTNIKTEGEFSRNVFNGELNVDDLNLGLDFIGSVDMQKAVPEFDFEAEVRNARIARLNLANRDTSARLDAKINIKLKGNNFDNLEGQLYVVDAAYHELDHNYKLRNLDLTATRSGEIKSLLLNSDFIEASIKGEYNIAYLGRSIKDHFKTILDSNYVVAEGPVQDFEFNILAKDANPITELFYPKLTLGPFSRFTGVFNNQTHHFKVNGTSPQVEFHGFTFVDYFLNTASSAGGKFDLSTGGRMVKMTDSLFIENLYAETHTRGDSLDLGIRWNNFSRPEHSADISGEGKITSLQDIRFSFLPSNITVNDTIWNINGNNLVNIDSGHVKIRQLVLKSEDQALAINGEISRDPAKNLDITFTDFNLANFNPVTQKEKITLGGNIDGRVSLSKFDGSPSVNSDLRLKQFEFNGEQLGNGDILSSWNATRQAIELDARLYRDTLTITKITGDYFPFREGSNLDLNANLNKVRLYVLNPFFEEIFSDINGIASGKIAITGRIEDPKLKGKINLQRTSLNVDYLKTAYSFSGEMRIEPTWFGFDNITIYDTQGNLGYVTGTVFHKNFKNFTYDIVVDGESLLALNTTVNDNPIYYGSAFFTGRVNISGYQDHLVIDVKGKTDKGTQLNFPLSGSEEITANSFIRFVNTSPNVPEEEYKVDLTGIEMNMEVDVTSDAEIQLIFDPAVGDIMKGRGNGRLNMNITPNGDFKIFGNFEIEEGEYLFTLMNVINKKFRVDKGGKINFSGDIYNATIDVRAVYKLRTTLYDIISEAPKGQRYPVETVLHLSNDLLRPDISFDIELPSADENTRSIMRSIISNEQERNRQTFALLTLNRFVAPQTMMADGNQSAHGNVGVATGVANSSELLSNQLSNWLSQISTDFDIGVKYRPGDELTNEELEVALSTQILNDRVLIDGNFGISNNQTTTDANTLLDGTIEYKLSEDGNFRVRAFNKSDPYRIADTGNPNRQGVGIFYRLEFDTLKELWNDKIKGIFRRKKQNTPIPD